MSSQPSCQSCWQPPLRGLVLPFLGFVLVVGGGCRKEEITVYHVPKEPPADVPAGHAEVAGPELRWQAPDHWQQLPAGGMRLANFLVPDAGGRTGQVSIVTLPTAMGQQVQVLNIFRERLQVPPLADADLPTLARQVPFGPGPGQLFDMLGEETADAAQQRARLLVAVLTNNAATWYFNFYGQSNLLEQEMGRFLGFLKSVEVVAGPAAAPAVAAAPAPTPAAPGGALEKPAWTAPDGWQETPPGQMQIARFTVSAGDGKLEITVAAFPGDVGGPAANVNRWRRQVGLEPVADDAALKSLTALDVPGGKAMLADMSNQRDGRRTRLMGVIWPRGDHTWFYKLTGDDGAAEREKAAFLKFVQSVRHRDA